MRERSYDEATFDSHLGCNGEVSSNIRCSGVGMAEYHQVSLDRVRINNDLVLQPTSNQWELVPDQHWPGILANLTPTSDMAFAVLVAALPGCSMLVGAETRDVGT